MRNFFSKTKGLWRTLVIVFMLIFVFAFTVGAILEANKAQVNRQLGTTTDVVVSDEDTEMYQIYTPSFATSTALVNEHVDVGTQLGAEGSVLLQNKNSALPLGSSEKISIFGYAGTSKGYYGMTVGGSVDASQNVTLYDALKDRKADVNSTLNDYNESPTATTGGGMWGFQFNGTTAEYKYSPTEIVYLESYDSENPPESTISQSYMTSLASGYTDVGIVVVGRQSSEAADYFPGTLGIDASTGARNVFALTDTELAMIDAVNNICTKTIVLIDSSNPMELGPIMTGAEHAVDAIMWVGFPGNYGYYGVADLLLGNSNPSGRLADTYAMDSTSSPAMQNFGLYSFTNADDIVDDYRGDFYLVEAEGIYTGYKYYETRYEDSVLGQGNATSAEGAFDSTSGWNYGEEIAYSFGEGLSYTTFEQTITGVTFSDDYKTATVAVTVENKGSVAGKSVVQVYGQSPYTIGGIEKASVQLLDYAKTDVIEPGSTAYVTVDVDMQLLASYDSGANNGEGSYVMEAGDYYFSLGCNGNQEGAHAAVNNILTTKGKTTSDGMDAEGSLTATYKFTWNAEDKDLFSTSKAGVEVTNQLQDADLNNSRWNCATSVSYLSRSDWTWDNSWDESQWTTNMQKGYNNVTATSSMIAQLNNYTYEKDPDGIDASEVLFDQNNGIEFSDMVNEDGSVVPYDDEKWDLLMDELNLKEAITFIAQGNRDYSALSIGFLGGTLTENGPTGIDGNIPSVSEAPWFDPNDPNSGYSFNDMGCAPLQASTFNKDLMERMGEMWGNDSLYTDIPILWAPSINTHRTPYNGRTAEYYSEDPVLSGYSAANISTGAEQFGLIVCIKHFAFNDQETNRNGVAPFFSEQKARENELRGFQIAFEGGVKATMTAFNRVGCTYSSAHKGLISGILRGEWGFTGYAISDMINPATYMTFTESVYAGTSSFDSTVIESDWGGNNATKMAKLYEDDGDMLQAIKDAVHADLWTFAHSNMMNYSNGEVKWVSNWWRNVYIILEVVGGVVACASLVLYVVAEVIEKKDKNGEEE